MRTIATAISLFLLGALSTSAEETSVVHIVSPGSTLSRPLTSDTMWKRIEGAASEYRQYAPVPRVAFFDITYPRDLAEYTALEGYGVLLVTVVTQDAAEIPLARVYLRGSSGGHKFQIVSSLQSPVPDASVRDVLGAHRFDALYLFPMHLRRRQAELVLDFAQNRQGFVLGKFPLEPSADEFPLAPPSKPEPPTDALARLLEREVSSFVELRPEE